MHFASQFIVLALFAKFSHGAASKDCSNHVYIECDFSTLVPGVPLNDTDQASALYDACHTTVSVSGTKADNFLNVFNSSDIKSKRPEDDPDLGSPNKACKGKVRGPGKGKGGRPGMEFENCDPLGNLIIIQNDKIDPSKPNDSPHGGCIYFDFAFPVLLKNLGLLDIDEKRTAKITLHHDNGYTSKFKSPKGIGNNGHWVSEDLYHYGSIDALEICLPGSGAISGLNYKMCEGQDEAKAPGNPASRVVDAKARLNTLINKNYEGLEKVRHITNGDEVKYGPDSEFPFIGNFHKTLPHYADGTVNVSAYQYMCEECVSKADVEACEKVPGMGGLANPMGGNYLPAMGIPPFASVTPPPPSVDSAELGLQYAELSWMAILGDIPFSQYGSDPLVQEAADSMSALAARDDVDNLFWSRPVGADGIDPATQLFRMNYMGTTDGPIVSQILHKEFTYDGIHIDPKMQTLLNHANMTWEQFLCMENGEGGFANPCFTLPERDTEARYIRNARDLGVLAQSDRITSVYSRAARIVLGFNFGYYASLPRQFGFATHGFARVNEQIVAVVAAEAHAWFSKWNVHRFLRPEAYGGLVEQRVSGGTPFPVHESLLYSGVIDELINKFGNALLPQLRGSPSHPSYPAGHAISAGACVTVLKVYADPDGNKCFPSPIVEASPDGLSLNTVIEDNSGDDCLTVNGELNKLAHNLSMGRDMSGVHWRADDVAGMLQGEEVAISYLQDELDRQPECGALKFISFEGDPVTLTPRRAECAEGI